MKKVLLIVPVLLLSIFVSAQHLEITIKIVGVKSRIAVKAIGGDITGQPGNNYIFTVAIPKANQAANLLAPTVLDPLRMPTALTTPIGTYTDPDGPGAMKYFNLFYSGPPASVTFVNNTEYELLELNWAGAAQVAPVSLISMAEGNLSAPVLAGQWLSYMEVNGAPFTRGDFLFYASTTSTLNSQMAEDYSSGTASVTSDLLSLPVSILNFSGYKNGTKNSLRWTTATESNNKGFEVQRSIDGVNYSAIGFVDSKALNGNSSTNISYTFDDNSPIGKKQYYRLLQKDFDGRTKQSNTISISGDKPLTLGIGGLFPNPAKTQVSVIIDAPGREDVTLMVTDMSGKTVKQQIVSVELGSNTVPVDISNLAQGSYFVKAVCKSSDCGMAVGKFNKQ